MDGRSVGRRGPRRTALRPRRLRHEGWRGGDPGRGPGAWWHGRPGRARGRAARRARPVRGGRRAGDARRDPRRRDGRPRDHPGAVGARHRGRPRRRHHVPADRPGPRGPRLAAARGRLGARQAVRALDGARGRRDPSQRGRDRSADDRAGAAVPDDHRDRRRWRMGLDRARPGDGRRPLRRPARPDRGRSRGRAAGVHRRGVCRGRLPARPSRHGRDHRRPVRVGPGAVGRSAAGRVWRRPSRRSRAVVPRSSASRTAPTCRCSSTSAARHA